MVRRKKIGMWTLALTVAALTSPLLIFSQNGNSQKMPNLELRLKPGQMVNGIPESFTFAFVNISNHDVRMPQPSRCSSSAMGTIYLVVELRPAPPPGIRGGCGEGFSGMGPMRDQAENWKVLKPGESLKVSFSRGELFSNEQAPGTYNFWAKYTPPTIPVKDRRVLTEEDIDFPRTHLVSPHLLFMRKK
jgi:hypothetical protein